MSSGRIGMILTYTRNKNNQNAAPAPAAPVPAAPAVPDAPAALALANHFSAPLTRQTYTRMNRFPKVSMSNIIHKPATGCSSCGN